MPRGPGKKENYNLDYSRFDFLDKVEQDDKVVAVPKKIEAEEDDRGRDDSDMPPVQDLLRGMPPEMQHAFHLMSIAKQNGDAEAQRRANELALKAVEKGGPQVQQDFIKTLSSQAPEVAKRLGIESGKEVKNPNEVLKRLLNASDEPAEPAEETFDNKCNKLRDQMQAGAEQARKQLEALERQQKQMEQMKSPEDLLKFMSDAGLTELDMQRMFGGDQDHMEHCVRNMLDSATNSVNSGKGADSAEAAIKAAEDLHKTICGAGDSTAESAPAIEEPPKPKTVKKPPEPPARVVTIPVYRLQYQKDEAGRYSAVELRCTLPGITAMSDVLLDVSEDHMRLTTAENAPGYAVNAGPFPVPIDPGAARAKYSKRKEELHIVVPAK
eukprot:TRINITY_DN54728_c0_g1_i1.p1 TRINITY_DN54728_c0_g1~~TRINITY_DN54728_c0_g1_i1.p1  ORF type:complete len:382 (-),score=115.95 TRINITY_DN54728_c0_g1_i1:183-1328(-)